LLNRDNYRFAKQVGCTHVVAHLVDYFNNSPAVGYDQCEYKGEHRETAIWSQELLDGLVADLRDEGLQPAAIENFEPAHWHDILLDGPRKKEQIENIKTMIRRVGKAGIPAIGYYFSLAGVWGQTTGPYARGGAKSLVSKPPTVPKNPRFPKVKSGTSLTIMMPRIKLSLW